MIDGLGINIRIGDFEVIRTPGVRIESERHSALTRMGIVLPDADRMLFKSISKGDAVEISMGYRDEEPALWSGTVSHLKPGNTKDQIHVAVVGPELPLVKTKVIQSWENESPEAIIKWAIGQAGLQVGQIDSPGCVFPRFSAANITIWDLSALCERTCQNSFNIDMSRWALWVDNDGKVNWGDFDAAGDIHVIETGAGLIRHTPSDALNNHSVIETFLKPGLRHSMTFKLNDSIRGVSGSYRALRVLHKMQNNRIRTFIGYGTEYEKF